jgi:hypothetical protein
MIPCSGLARDQNRGGWHVNRAPLVLFGMDFVKVCRVGRRQFEEAGAAVDGERVIGLTGPYRSPIDSLHRLRVVTLARRGAGG